MKYFVDGEPMTAKEMWWRVRKGIAGWIAPEAIKYEADMEYRFSCLLDHATGGRMSKTNYTIDAMYGEVDNHISDCERLAIDEMQELSAKAE